MSSLLTQITGDAAGVVHEIKSEAVFYELETLEATGYNVNPKLYAQMDPEERARFRQHLRAHNFTYNFIAFVYVALVIAQVQLAIDDYLRAHWHMHGRQKTAVIFIPTYMFFGMVAGNILVVFRNVQWLKITLANLSATVMWLLGVCIFITVTLATNYSYDVIHGSNALGDKPLIQWYLLPLWIWVLLVPFLVLSQHLYHRSSAHQAVHHIHKNPSPGSSATFRNKYNPDSNA